MIKNTFNTVPSLYFFFEQNLSKTSNISLSLAEMPVHAYKTLGKSGSWNQEI